MTTKTTEQIEQQNNAVINAARGELKTLRKRVADLGEYFRERGRLMGIIGGRSRSPKKLAALARGGNIAAYNATRTPGQKRGRRGPYKKAA